MQSKIEIKGYWWIPSTPDTRLPGTLLYTPGKSISLEVFGKLGDGDPLSTTDIRIINGIAENRSITLLACHTSHMEYFSSGIHTSKYSALELIIGHVFASETDLLFDTLTEETTQLAAWCCSSGITVNYKYDCPKGVTINEVIPESISLGNYPPFRFSIEFFATIPGRSIVSRELTIRETPRLKIETDRPIPLNDLLAASLKLKHLLTFLVGKSVRPLSWAVSSQSLYSELNGQRIPEEIEVIRVIPLRDKDKEDVLPQSQVLPLPGIRSDMHRLVSHFFENYDAVSSPLELLLETKSRRMYSVEQFFLHVAQACESFHRRIIGGTEDITEEHQKRIAEILETCPEACRKWLKSKLEFSNEISFRSRIRYICECQPELMAILPYAKDKFIHNVVVYRNYLTHFTDQLRRKIDPNIDLYFLARDLRTLLEALVLKWLGVSNEVILTKYSDILKNTNRKSISL